VTSRLAQLAKGVTVRDDKQFRTAAGLLAFAQCVNVEIEPSIAFHELAHKQGNEVAVAELGWFHAANNANPQDLLDVALERRNLLAGQHRPIGETSGHDLAKPLKRWRRNYIIALKMVELEQSDLLPVDRVLRLFQWMHDDFMFGGSAALMASIYFAPNSPRKRGVFKDKNSLDREAAIAGVRNAAWDLTHLSEFVRRVNDEGDKGKTRYIFASFDKHLCGMAKFLFEFCRADSSPEALPKALCQWWSNTDATRISSNLYTHLARVRSPQWASKPAPRPDFIDDLIREAENRLRSSKPLLRSESARYLSAER
jgi:hypothetical protein